MDKGENMSRQELAQALRDAMLGNDLSYKEVAYKLDRSITTVQNILAARPVSKRTFARVQLILTVNGKSL